VLSSTLHFREADLSLFFIIQNCPYRLPHPGSLSRRDRVIWARRDLVALMAPIDHYFIASNFGIQRDPFNGRLAFHAGLDLSNALLSPVLSTSPGLVVYVGWMGGYGRLVEIDHGLGVQPQHSTICCATHSAVGCSVTWTCSTSRLAWLTTKKP
jgi:Peptidase family M23